MVKNKGDKMKMNIDTLINEKMNENEDKNKIEIMHKTNPLLNNYTLIKLNGELLRGMRVRNMGFFTDGFGTRNMILTLNIPLDRYEIIIHPYNKE